MAKFSDLPLELLPIILVHLIKPHHLASACLVNKLFHTFAVPWLYNHVSIYSWHKEGKTKVVRLFDTLSRSHQLAKHVHRLEIREFPKSLSNSGITILNTFSKGLRNCTSLRGCTWTRDGSLSSEILMALHSLQELQELEINGNSDGNYNPVYLSHFTRLTKISIIMPRLSVLSQLTAWLPLTAQSLNSFTLICSSSHIVTDKLLEKLAPSLANVTHLNFTGCLKVTHRGVWAIISSTRIRTLQLKGVSVKFDLTTFTDRCMRADALRYLRSITLTVDQHTSIKRWTTDVLNLLSSAPLEVFRIYSTGDLLDATATDYLWTSLVRTHGHRLKKLSVHRMLISIDSISGICLFCPSLEELFVLIEPHFLNDLVECLSHAKSLRILHINYPFEASLNERATISQKNALGVVQRCSSTITQIGCNTEVGRTVIVDERGELSVRLELLSYESPDIPEAFLVVQT
ncbi:hypothetical protein K443DRAFT_115368 [Laccaria amethystina LaAM-08-1]|uniref:F-box domain-containing protein n=1 Tax=Laccaria amethystina LaAM-08-1 TaxID=1095629 RepID=A0A0C9WHH4_9AGAR|nr:hypothetical protein K443DRAFT_115368 [Laccaria amethystina LaAM-08-1]